MDALITAGGIPKADDPLFEHTQGGSKAMLDIAGKPMVQWTIDALCHATQIDSIVVIGLDEGIELQCEKPVEYVPNQGGMLDNLHVGTEKIAELNSEAKYVLVTASDIPSIKSEMVDWVIKTAMETEHEVYYNIIQRETMEKRFPGANRSYVKLKEIEVCGGDMNVVAIKTILGDKGLWYKISDARKNAFKQAALIGFDTLFLLLLRQLTVQRAIQFAKKRLNVDARVLICPFAEVAMDIDKPHQLAILRNELAQKAGV